MAELTEARIYEALGLDIPEGAQVQEPAEPAAQTSQAVSEEGAQAQEPAEPASEPADNAQDGADTPEPGAASADDSNTGDNSDPGKKPLTPQQRRENAARRRQQENQAAIDQAVRQALAQERANQADAMKGFFARAGQIGRAHV